MSLGKDHLSPLRNPLIVALDVDEREEALQLARSIGDVAGGFKLGPRLVVRYGESIVKEIAQLAPVFIDLKFLDIPNTMESSVRAAFAAGASLVTVHAWGGKEALQRLSVVEKELSAIRPFRILVVTILTSFTREGVLDIMGSQVKGAKAGADVSLLDRVVDLADLARDCGLKGVVCSAQESALVRQRHADNFIVTPGIRFPSESLEDQKRVTSPSEAMANGASAIVVGRPIVEAQDPLAQARRFYDEVIKG